MLIVGWSGTEYHFLDLLKQSFKKDVPTLVVAENKEAAEATFKRIHNAGVKVVGECAGDGFSDFVVSRHAERFLRES